MQRRCYDAIHGLSILLGSVALLVDIVSNTQWMHEQVGTWLDSSIALVITIGIGGATCLTASFKAFRDQQPMMASGLAVLWVACVAFSMSATLDRVASQRDAKIASKMEAVEKKNAERLQHARSAKTDATDTYLKLITHAQDKAVDACAEADKYRRYRDDTRVAKVIAARAECTRWQTEVARNRDIAATLIKTQPKPQFQNVVAISEVDAYGKRIAAYTRGAISAETANLYLPALAPICLILMASLLLSWGLNGRIEAPEFSVELTGKAAEEAKVTRFVVAYRSENGVPPSIAAVAAQCGITESKAQRMRKKALAEIDG